MNVPITSEININEHEWTELNNKYDKETIKNWLVQIIRYNNIPFPQTIYSIDQVKEDFLKLCEFDTQKIISDEIFDIKQPLEKKWDKRINLLWKQSYIGNKSSNYFHEKTRFNVKRIGREYPHDVWNNDVRLKLLMNSFWSMKYKKIGKAEMKSLFRLGMYQAGQFRTTVAKGIYDYFKAKNIFDMSMGWGDRLAGFNSSKYTKNYIGTDPNTLTYNNYQKQHEFYNTGKTLIAYNKPAEELTELPDIPIDLCFSSPPYFIKEQYSSESTQSCNRYKDLKSWLNNFLFKTLLYQYECLKHDGILAINITDVIIKGEWQEICSPMIEYILSLNNMKYLGFMGMKISSRPALKTRKIIKGSLAEPIWVFKKE